MTTSAPRPNPRPRGPVPPLPLTVLTGFLGAGKTTLLNQLVRDPALADAAVIINEFGEIGLDHLLVERVDDNIVMLATGCLCCTMRGDLVDALEKLLRDRDNGRLAFNRVVIETTGLADPAPVVHTTMAHPYLSQRFRLDGIITVVDAINGMATLDAQAESIKQAALADRLVLTKTDLATSDAARAATAELAARLRRLNPAAPILDAAEGEAGARALIDCGLYDPSSKIPDVGRWLAEEAYAEAQERQRHDHAHGHEHGHGHDHSHDHAHHHDVNRHDDRIRAFSFTTDAAIPASLFDMFVELMRSMHGPNLLRLKGIVKIAEMPDTPIVVHGVQHLFHPPARLEGWPDTDHRTRIVCIVRDIEPRKIQELFDAFLNSAPVPDQADRTALADNPLVPFGGVDR